MDQPFASSPSSKTVKPSPPVDGRQLKEPVSKPDLSTESQILPESGNAQPSSLMAGLDPDQANALTAWYWAGYYAGRLSRSG